VTAIRNARPRALGGRAGDDADPSVDVAHDDLEHAMPLVLGQPRDLAGHAQRRHPLDARLDEQVDNPFHAALVELA
jgi:hypothetical protein